MIKRGLKIYIEISRIIRDETLTEKELADLNKIFEAAESSEGEIWIGRKESLPYKISLSPTMKGTDELGVYDKADITLLFKNFNKPVQIEIPTQVKKLEEILGGLFGGLKILAPMSISQRTAVTYFYSPYCPHCVNVNNYLSANTISLKFIKLDTSDTNNQKLLKEKAAICGLCANNIGVPFLWDGKNCIVGDADIINFFKKYAL